MLIKRTVAICLILSIAFAALGRSDRAALDLSSRMAEPFCWAYGLIRYRMMAPLDPNKFDNYDSEIKEVAYRLFIGIGASLTAYTCYLMPVLALGSLATAAVGSRVLRAVGFALQGGGFTHVRGEGKEKELNGQCKIVSKNIAGLSGGLHYDHGGVIHWRQRIGGIVEQIKQEDPDVLFLQEVYDTALAEALIKELNPSFAHFYIHLGPSSMGSACGIAVFTKCAVHDFSFTSFTNNNWSINRGFATLEVKRGPEHKEPCLRILGTHLVDGYKPKNKASRLYQIGQMINSVRQATLPLPTMLAGDLNETPEKLLPYFHLAYRGHIPTCTNRLTEQWYNKVERIRDENIDNICLFKKKLPDGRILPVIEKNVELRDCYLIQAFDSSYNTKTALSDHHGVAVSLIF